MKANKYFKKQQHKLILEALLKSALCGLAVGFSANFIAALATWFAPFNGLWLSLWILLGVTVLSTPIFYFTRFRPTAMSSARRIDSLGLKERLVTMVEYDNDDSYIARIQRNDAQAALSKIDMRQLKICVSRVIIVSVIICAILGAGMTTVNALGEYGIIPEGDEIVESIIEDQTTEWVTLSYVIEEGGIIEGDEDQIIVKGADASTITAVADEGYMFKMWSDGSTDPTRTDKAVVEDAVYLAVFVPVEDGEGQGEGDGDGEGDQPQDAPSEPGEEGGGSSGDPGDPGENSSSAGGGQNDPNNQILDGSTYYRGVLESYQDAAGELIQNPDSGLSDAEKAIIEKYLGIV